MSNIAVIEKDNSQTIIQADHKEIEPGSTLEKGPWFNLKEAAKYLGIHTDTLHKYVAFGLIKTTGIRRPFEELHIERNLIEELKATPDWIKNLQKYTKRKPVPIQAAILSMRQAQIIQEIHNLHTSGEPLNPMYLLRHHKGLYQRIRNYYGCQVEALKAAGIPPQSVYIRNNVISGYEERFTITSQKREAKRNNLLLEIRNLIDNDQLDCKTTRKLDGMVSGYLGGWQNVRKLLGLKFLMKTGNFRKIKTKEDVIIEIQNLHNQAIPLNSKSMGKKSILFQDAKLRFGSWANAIEAAGLNYSEIDLRQRKTKDRFVFTFKDDFEKYLQFDRQCVRSTIEFYKTCLTQFQSFVKKDLDSVSEENVRGFSLFLKEKGRKITNIAQYISALRIFYGWLAYKLKTENVRTINYYLKNIMRIKTKKAILNHPITQEDIIKLRNSFQNYKQSGPSSSCHKRVIRDIAVQNYKQSGPSSSCHKRVIRDIAVLELLITTGMRQGELRNLRYCDVDLEKKIIIIKTSKTGLPRKSIFGETASSALVEYFSINNFHPDDLIFPLQGNTLSYMTQRWQKRAQLGKAIYAHLFRHYFITETLRRGVSIQNVAKQVGHTSLNSTFYYTNIDIETIREDLEKNSI